MSRIKHGTVIGIDPSLRAAGIAVIHHAHTITPPHAPKAVSVGSSGRKGMPLADRAHRIHEQSRRILAELPADPRLIVIEGLIPGATGAAGQYAERAALWWTVAGFLARRGIPVAEVAPATLKRWATGDGRADKAAVIAAMRAYWPHTKIPDDNAADALALATMGAQRIGWQAPELEHHHEPRVDWPAA